MESSFSAEDFVHYPFELMVEQPMRYEPGGYHPIIIGHIFRSPTRTASYRIVHKLGHGTFSTVWLAENSDLNPKYVAVKVSTADSVSSNESGHLQSASSPYIVPVFDSFFVEGPNGTHYVLVTEVLLPLCDFLDLPHTLETRRKIIWQLVKAVEDLHRTGLAHGGNAGVTLAQIQSLSIFELTLEVSDPILTVIILDEMTKNTASLPAYTTERCDMKGLYKQEGEHELQAKLFDFGSVRRHDDDGEILMYERRSRAPEILEAVEEYKRVPKPPLRSALDIWDLGALIYKIITGSPVTYYAGDLYPLDASASETDRKVYEDRWWETVRSNLRKHCPNDADCDTLISLFKKIFVLNPFERPSAETIAQDKWFDTVSKLLV